MANEKKKIDYYDAIRTKIHWIVMSIGATAYAISARFSYQDQFLKFVVIAIIAIFVGIIAVGVGIEVRARMKRS